jgi:hypothetical protein
MIYACAIEFLIKSNVELCFSSCYFETVPMQAMC